MGASTDEAKAVDPIPIEAHLASTGEVLAPFMIQPLSTVKELCFAASAALGEAAASAGGKQAPQTRGTNGLRVASGGRILEDGLPISEAPGFSEEAQKTSGDAPPKSVAVEFLRCRPSSVATASMDGMVKIWCGDSGECVATFEASEDVLADKKPLLPGTSIMTPDRVRLVRLDGGTSARIYVAATDQLAVTLSGHSGNLRHATFSYDGLWVATASEDGTAKLWDARKGKCLRTFVGHRAEVVFVAFSPDGRKVATASQDHSARIWDANTGECLGKLLGHRWPVNAVAFSWDSALLITSSDDRTARIWDAKTYQSVRCLEGHRASLTEAVFLE
eukprot:TRINITY_DN15856_c0_g1_i1.p1 TRINITY_DN15856_c0_g1~~TRINITY_DN15856_c0_g1_i1.p1  ORF type:complete len:333 (-),score=63.22 TRINITY_DN15856_c0_g1_i1:137-1135(-)